jgi:hypothetical protein
MLYMFNSKQNKNGRQKINYPLPRAGMLLVNTLKVKYFSDGCMGTTCICKHFPLGPVWTC